ncbi:M48 family metallopeptidase [Dactylosporangium sp. AC04546]|uniref:M48 family metallopeptidase n=1 Tax=Dactylosporangium sp. AC04546 TaxID=2862460 RepID=UPI001EDE9642|nr:M48 family metallopeptidase [Dactylosporangium sp. AC04546]WVK86062.1 M48 family metallopeptidase [Dactylosporangium sp. AC04546]
MTVAIRAFVSIVMLAGFYVLAFVQLVAGMALSFWLATVGGSGPGAQIGIAVFLATVWAVGYGTYKAVRADNGPPPGVELDEDDAPRLWATVRELAEAAGTRPPDEIRLVPEVNAAVVERSRLMGLLGGRRYLFIGMPLLQTLNIAQLRAVLAHELGHYSEAHTRFAGISQRGRLALVRTVGHISEGNLAGWVFRGYTELYVAVQNAVSRRQELEADRTAVRVAGRPAAASALKEVEVLDTAYDFYVSEYLGPGIAAGCVPEDVFGSFAELLRARAEELSALRHAQPAAVRAGRHDTHPPLAERLAAIAAAPDPVVDADTSPATELVPGARAAGRELQGRIFPREGLVELPWDEFRTATVNAGLQARTDTWLRLFAREVGKPVPHVDAVLTLIDDGWVLGDLVPPDGTLRDPIAGPLETMFQLAAVRSGAGRWRHSWVGPSVLVDRAGDELDLADIAGAATVAEARQRLAALNIDPAAARHVQQVVNTRQAEIYGGISQVKVDGKRSDLLVLSHGLLVVPGVRWYKARSAWFRVNRWIKEGTAREVAALPGTRFVAYEEIVRAVRTSSIRFRWELELHDGTTVRVRTILDSTEHGPAYALFARAVTQQ